MALTRREQILDTAAGLFAERGFHGVSVADLGAACGISGPALYKHFASKDAVLAMMLVDISEELLRVGNERSAAAEDAVAALHALVAWHVDFALDHQPLIVVQDRDWSSLPDSARERVRELQRRYVDLWAGRLQQVHPSLTGEPARAMAHAAFGLINSTPHSATLPGPQMRTMLGDMAVRALGLRAPFAGSGSPVPGPRVGRMALATYKDLSVDAVDPAVLGPFWASALGLELHPEEGPGSVAHLTGASPQQTVWLARVPETKTVKHRVHLDLNVASVEELTRAGATVLDADSFPWTVLADPEGGELCAFVREGAIAAPLYEVIVDCADSAEACAELAAWWADVLGGRLGEPDPEGCEVQDIPGAPFEYLVIGRVPEAKTVKNRIHLDVTTPDLDALVAAGAVVLRPQDDEISWTVLADPAGNEFCAFVEAQGDPGLDLS